MTAVLVSTGLYRCAGVVAPIRANTGMDRSIVLCIAVIAIIAIIAALQLRALTVESLCRMNRSPLTIMQPAAHQMDQHLDAACRMTEAHRGF